jgi:hypothetical protein
VTKYPVPYLYWRKKPGESISLDDDLDEVLDKIKAKQWMAQPINPDEPTSPWLTARPKALTAIQKAIGQSYYRAYAGSCTWANGVYWLEITGTNSAGQVIVRNLSDVGKLEGIEQVEVALEPDLLYPLVRGRDVGRWQASASACLLAVQDPKKRQGYDEDWLKEHDPLTYAYLLRFEKLLRHRSGFRKYFCDERGKPQAPFYSLYNIGEYTLTPYKVCWREQAEFLTCAVVEGAKLAGKNKVIIPDHKLMFVPLADKCEAHYLCAILNSAATVLVVKSYGIETQTSTHLLEHVRIPQFNAKDKLHQRLAELSAEAHRLAGETTEQSAKQIQKSEAEIDSLVAEVWGITVAELHEIQSSLADLQ